VTAELKSLVETTVEVAHVEAASKLTTQAVQIQFPTFNNLTQQDGSEGYGVQEQDLQDYNRKLQEFDVQQQALQNLQAQLQNVRAQIQAGQAQMQAGLPGGNQGELPQGGLASEQRPAPHFVDLSNSVAIGEADMEAQLQHALFGEAAGLSSAQPVGFGSSRIPPIAVGADLPIAEAILLEPAPAEEFGQDMASMIWKANQAGGGADGSRSSSVSTVVGRMTAATLEDAGEALECGTCWGAHLNGGATCKPQFVPGKLHFKNKFCDNCKDSIIVPTSRICVLSTELAACFVNKRSEGFWNRAPESMGSGQYRIINNTAGCIGPRLALFRDQPPPCDWSATSRSNR